MIKLKTYLKKEIEEFYITREGETKLGETIKFATSDLDYSINDAVEKRAKYAILGIPESIGVRANLGISGTQDAWKVFLKKFLNMQHNQFLQGESIFLLGEVYLDDLREEAKTLNKRNPEDLKKLRALTSKIDDRVFPIITKIVKNGLIPIVVGGGHNNAYPIIKGFYEFNKKKISAVNLDAHADFRLIEGRHSGNPFSYAYEEGFLESYFVLGLDEQYNSQTMSRKLLDLQRNGKVDYVSHEDIIKEETLKKALYRVKNFLERTNNYYGLELDLDSVERIPSSAMRPSGLTLNEARKYVIALAKEAKYFHVCEAAPGLGMDGVNTVGKAISYLVCDFIKNKN